MTKKRRKSTLTPDKITLRQGYTEFIQDKIAINSSKETLRTYGLHITNFLETSNLWDVDTHLLTKDDYQRWIERLQRDTSKKDVTVASYCRSVRAFIYWLQDYQYTDAYSLQIPKYQKTIKVCYTDQELSLLLKKPQKCTEVQFQTWVFINLVCATGMRLSSALSLKISDIQMNEHTIYLQSSKNNRAQIFLSATKCWSF